MAGGHGTRGQQGRGQQGLSAMQCMLGALATCCSPGAAMASLRPAGGSVSISGTICPCPYLLLQSLPNHVVCEQLTFYTPFATAAN